MKLAMPALVLLSFGAFSVWVCLERGYFGFLELAAREPWGLQVLLDLTIALSMLVPLLWRDARARKIVFWPFLVATLFLGSIGPLAYLVVRALRSDADEVGGLGEARQAGVLEPR